MAPTTIADIGLPQSTVELAYHLPTQTIIAHANLNRQLPPRKRLFFRRGDSRSYQPAATLPDDISIDSFVIDPVRPVLYFLTNSWKSVPGTRGASGNWEGLFRFDLNEHRTERLTVRDELPAPGGYDGTWLCKLLTVSEDGGTVVCKAGLLRRSAEDETADYWICEFDLTSRQLRPLTHLEALFA